MQRPVTIASRSRAFSLVACCTLITTTAFVVPSISYSRACPSATRLHAAASVAPAGSVAASLEALHDATMAKLTDTLKVEATDYPASMEVESYSGKSGVTGSVAGYKGNVRLVWTGEGKMMREEGTQGGGMFRSDIAIWVGPLTLVPHLVMSLELGEGEGGKEGEVKVLLDYVSREDLQYTTGNNHLTDYFAGPAREATEAAATDPLTRGRVVLPSFYSRVLVSPSAVSLSLPASPAGITKAGEWMEAHVSRWLGWCESAKEVDRMKRGLLLSRDNGVRRTWVEGTAGGLEVFVGGREGGKALAKQAAIAMSGPQQEAYVGGFS